jgi:hypothetical protein
MNQGCFSGFLIILFWDAFLAQAATATVLELSVISPGCGQAVYCQPFNFVLRRQLCKDLMNVRVLFSSFHACVFKKLCQVLWSMPVQPALGMLRQKFHVFKASSSYILRLSQKTRSWWSGSSGVFN